MDLFVVGEIVKTRGLQGCLKVLTQLETKNIIPGLDVVYLENKQGGKKCYGLKNLVSSGKFFLIELKDVADVNSAKTLVGCKVLVPRGMLADLPEGEYYCRDIIGLDVYNEEGDHLGRITSVFSTGGNDVYVCKGQREILLPAIADVVRRIDLDNNVMIVRLLEGL